MKEVVKNLWKEYCSTLTSQESLICLNEPYEVWDFGVDRESSEKLKRLVLNHKKTATTGLWDKDNPVPLLGSKAIILNNDGLPFCVIEYTEIKVKPFNEVTFDYAVLEGENTTLTEWQQEHRKIFSEWRKIEGSSFSDTDPVICHTFNLIFVP